MNKTLTFLTVVSAVALAQGVMDLFGEEGREEHRRHHRHSLLPPYLHNVSCEAKWEYFKIVGNRSLTFAEKRKEISEWAKKYNVVDEVASYNAYREKLKQEHRKNVSELVSALPNAVKKVNDLLDNENQTPRQLYVALRKLGRQNPALYRIVEYINVAVRLRSEEVDEQEQRRRLSALPFGDHNDNLEEQDFGEQDFRYVYGFECARFLLQNGRMFGLNTDERY
uniref:Gut-associated larval antigen-1 n=1 Tax=Cyathostomum cf. pateratum HM-2009 TaxID=674123 RepID=C8YYM0_9BILA|nr:gut-associated larval antigen-1 [Cyathostomum cf. pateratum HM-2009]